jgi:hypothetical protein
MTTATDITFIRVTDAGATADCERSRSIFAVRDADFDDAVRELASTPQVDLDRVNHAALPGLAELAATQMFGVEDPPRLVLIGTAVGDQWATWYPPIPEPAVPR